MGWVILAVVILVVGFGMKMFSGDSGSKAGRPTQETKVSKDENLIEIRKEYWENGNLKSEIPYKKHYGLGWKKVKTTLIPHGIAKTYYANGVLESEDPYVDGERTGELKFYDEEGKLIKSVSYLNSLKEGKTVYYYDDGSVLDVEYYKEGNLTEAPEMKS
jgi:antitoxin component YwqK of YwqJK toxin-antitoxin module